MEKGLKLTEADYHWRAQACPICVSEPARYLGRRGGAAHRQCLGIETRLWRCGGCGLIFPNPMPIPKGGLEQHYGLPPEEYFAAHDEAGKAESAVRLLQKAETLGRGKGRLLDVGAGRGEILYAAKQAGWEVVGIEPSPPFARWAARNSGVEVLTEAIENCSLPAESFEVVILAAVLEHLYEPDAVIRSIARVLRPGGLLFVDVPNEAGLYFHIGNLYQRLRLRNWVVNLSPTFSPFHVFGFTPQSLRRLLAKHGLTPLEWRMYGGTSLVPHTGGWLSAAEKAAARIISDLSNYVEMGTYIETWARKA
ncbi:MAG: methyltransferase domain-containing protein [Acidobacteria bacterium]|nr:methyltransferase domain-containing protein [Acidobacteriota bacterium]MBI3421487.1 methyltransferase domain-containing protein [Acidobacteriota bacterium]